MAMAQFAARFQRPKQPPANEERIGEILSDNSDLSSIEDANERPQRPQMEEKEENEDSASAKNDRRKQHRLATNGSVDNASISSNGEEQELKITTATPAKIHQKPPSNEENKTTRSASRKSTSRKWYSDSDEEEDEEAKRESMEKDKRPAPKRDNQSNDESEEEEEPVKKPNASRLKKLNDKTMNKKNEMTLPPPMVTSPPSESNDPKKKTTGFQRLVAKTKTLSPFGSKRKGFDASSPASSTPGTPETKAPAPAPKESKAPASKEPTEIKSPASDVASPTPTTTEETTIRPRPRRQSQETQPTPSSDVVSPDAARKNPSSIATIATVAMETNRLVNRRTSRLKQSPLAEELGTLPRTLGALPEVSPSIETASTLSPGQRKLVGAFPGKPGSGVLLEGWLRQKQRRGVKGMKKWNARYFVLYAKTNEVRYYADVVQSAWGPIPLGEIGSISLRLIQRIGKPSHPKYKGCRFDITCRNTWGTHYADDYVSSDDENEDQSNVKPDKTANSTPRSSRVYSLMADSPQTTVAWVNMLDSLLVRSANSPRPDVSTTAATVVAANRMKTAVANRTMRRRSSTLDMETSVLLNVGEAVPSAVLYAIKYIFDSTPGIETPLFYEQEPDATALKNALRSLNQCAMEKKPPSREQLDTFLNPTVAGGVVKCWLKQLEQPLIPFEMYPDFVALGHDAKTAPFELQRNLKAMVDALPRKHFTMLACLLFHLNDVNVYASKNQMDAARLSEYFAEFVLRARNVNEPNDRPSVLRIVEEMISHVDAIIDEKEAEILNRV